MFTSENMPYILLALAVAAALYYFFVYKKQVQAYKEAETAPEKIPATEMYEEEPYEEEAYVDEEPGAELEKKSK
jgi:hypothetical protein